MERAVAPGFMMTHKQINVLNVLKEPREILTILDINLNILIIHEGRNNKNFLMSNLLYYIV